MIRSDFIKSILAAGASWSFFGSNRQTPEAVSAEARVIQPPFLKKGSRIGIPSPAGYMTLQELKPAMDVLLSWGYEPVVGKGIGQQWGNMGGSDEVRLADFQQMLDDTSLQAILCARGGYGLIRIIDKLDFSTFIRRPKWIIGFSDLTVIHCHLNRQLGIASIHAKMCNSFPAQLATADPVVRDTILELNKVLTGEATVYKAEPFSANIPGIAAGELVGGNLSVFQNLTGTRSGLYTKNKILFLEDAGEYLYHFDRMFWNLDRAGLLKDLKALILGGFRVKPSEDPKEEFALDLPAIVLEKVRKYGYPVAFQFPVGHQKNNFPLKSGAIHELRVSEKGAVLQEIIAQKL